jgi:ParB family chromosome partitioning protein
LAERLVARATQPGGGSTRTAKATPKPRDITRIEERLADALTAPVEIRLRKGRAGQGEIAIPFGSLDELDALLDKLGGSER